jgi:murein DD-endopeptidase MepM/ murein hydrolase activator NlpD
MAQHDFSGGLVTSEFDSAPERRSDQSRPEEGGTGVSRREARLRAEQEKVAAIARERERERIREAALARAAEIRREKEAARAREADHERFQKHINDSQQVPTLSYADRGHEGAQRVRRAEARARKREEARAKSAPKPVSASSAARAHRLRNGAGRAAVVMVVSGLLAVLALPATGFNIENNGWAAEEDRNDQSVKVTATGSEAEQVALGEYVVTTYSDLLKLTYGASLGFKYSVTNSGPIRWPFPVVVPISSGFGGRAAPCLGCSSYHEGLDFNPVEGTPFYAVADGEVIEVNNDTWGYGKWVVIRHQVGKKSFDSLYAHMIRDSTGVRVGQQVKVGDYIGRVGNTGTSTGAHLHFSILIDGVHVDPFKWLKENTKGN